MKVAIFGADGQLGRALTHTLDTQYELVLFTHSLVDIADRETVRVTLAACRPSVVINAAAMTDVNFCERDPAAAHRVNALGARWLAEGSKALGALLLHVSTDYVFSGRDHGCYHEWDETSPLQEYGRSKLAGEHEVRSVATRFAIIRTSWLYGGQQRGFVPSILDRGRQGLPLRVVSNQRGSPSYTRDVAEGIGSLLAIGVEGTVHLSNTGCVSRYGLAKEICRQAGIPASIEALDSVESTSPAQRPSNTSIISHVTPSLGIHMRPWKEALADFLEEEAKRGN